MLASIHPAIPRPATVAGAASAASARVGTRAGAIARDGGSRRAWGRYPNPRPLSQSPRGVNSPGHAAGLASWWPPSAARLRHARGWVALCQQDGTTSAAPTTIVHPILPGAARPAPHRVPAPVTRPNTPAPSCHQGPVRTIESARHLACPRARAVRVRGFRVLYGRVAVHSWAPECRP